MVINQVNRLFLKQYLTKQFYRNVFYAKPRKVLYPLLNRSLLKVSGQDAVPFLQGLITNDMEHLQDGANSIYAMFLNNKGRVLYDTVIYRWENDNTFLVECDKTSNNLVMKHLKMYRLRKDVEIDDINSEFRLYALITPTDSEVDTDLHPKKKINVFKDPRLIDLGHRVIVARKAGNQFLENNFGECTFIENDDTGYKYLRYKLGVSEGSLELSPGVCFPLESNCDYLHGVSFHKGCYIGQELTARVHHTGVVRKRIMPLRFQDVIISDIEKNTTISTNDTKPINLGKFINSVNDFGIGLVRCKEATEAKIMKIGDVWAEVVKPSWWPIEAPKEKIVTNKPVIDNAMEEIKLKEEPVHIVYDFKCVSCTLDEKAHYKGTHPPFSRNVVLKYPSYVLKDPFSPPGKGEILVLGSDCSQCDRPVCISKDCSIFYEKNYCLDCAQKCIESFPGELKIRLVQLKKK